MDCTLTRRRDALWCCALRTPMSHRQNPHRRADSQMPMLCCFGNCSSVNRNVVSRPFWWLAGIWMYVCASVCVCELRWRYESDASDDDLVALLWVCSCCCYCFCDWWWFNMLLLLQLTAPAALLLAILYSCFCSFSEKLISCLFFSILP